jgi:transposase
MLSLPSSVRIFVCLQAADMRRSFDGLAWMVEQYLCADPLSGHLFVFRNRRGDRLKILYWDRDGLAIWYKRLEEGTSRFPRGNERSIQVTATELSMLLDGIDLPRVKKRRRYNKYGSSGLRVPEG